MLPGNVSAFTDAPIYARTSGYLKRWYFDIGAPVKKGALLAEISTPELDQQLAQTESDLATAQATANNARIQADRYSGLVKTDAVSQQDTDTYVNQAAATAAAVRSAQANVQRLRELQSFEKIYAPFDGVITARTVDTGQLIDTGAGHELFHLQALGTLRVYANLPQAFAQSAKRGMKIDLTFADRPGKVYAGTLTRTADAIDPAVRCWLRSTWTIETANCCRARWPRFTSKLRRSDKRFCCRSPRSSFAKRECALPLRRAKTALPWRIWFRL
jgi:RND family efflux transporter MFP subunit